MAVVQRRVKRLWRVAVEVDRSDGQPTWTAHAEVRAKTLEDVFDALDELPEGDITDPPEDVKGVAVALRVSVELVNEVGT